MRYSDWLLVDETPPEVIREDEEVVEVNAVIGRVEPTWNLICVTQRESGARQILRRARLDHLPYLVRAIHDTNLVGIRHTVDHVDLDVMRLPGGDLGDQLGLDVLQPTIDAVAVDAVVPIDRGRAASAKNAR